MALLRVALSQTTRGYPNRGGVQRVWVWGRGDGRRGEGRLTRKIARAEPFRTRVAGLQRVFRRAGVLFMAPLEGLTTVWFPECAEQIHRFGEK